MRPTSTLLLPALLLPLLACTPRPIYPAGEDPCREQVKVAVTDSHDGDTIVVEPLEGDAQGIEEDVRLIGIDTPEVDHNGDDHDCFALPAWQETIDLLDGEEAWLTFDAECTDAYGRSLAYVFTGGDGLFVNGHLVEQGFARACPFPPNTAFSDDFDEAELAAQAGNRGRWAEPCNGGPECFGGG
jgi:micrococcal nuclease